MYLCGGGRHAMLGVEQLSPFQQDASNAEHPVSQANRTSNLLDTRVAPLARIEPDRLYRLADKTPPGRTPCISSPHAGMHWKTREPEMPLCMTSMNY
jgi:hypothetical protein